jgi:hypothetical protein
MDYYIHLYNRITANNINTVIYHKISIKNGQNLNTVMMLVFLPLKRSARVFSLCSKSLSCQVSKSTGTSRISSNIELENAYGLSKHHPRKV